MIKKCLLLLFCTSTAFFSAAQKLNKDSLLQIADRKKEDAAKVDAMMYYALQHIKSDTAVFFDYSGRGNGIAKKIKYSKGEIFYCIVMGDYYRLKINFPLSTQFCEKGLEISLKNNYDSLSGLLYHNKGSNFQLQSMYNDAMMDYEKAYSFRKKGNDKAGLAGTLNNMASLYKIWGDLPKALDLYLQASAINIETGNKNWLAKNYNNIGGVYHDMKDEKKSLEYYYKSIDLKKEEADTTGLIASYNNIGMVLKSFDMYDSSLSVLNISVDLAEKSGNKNINHLSTTHINMSSALIDLKKYDEALEHIKEAIRICEYNKDKITMAGAYLKMGETYMKMHKPSQAIPYFKKTYAIADEVKSLEKKMWASLGLSTTCEQAGDYKTALFYAHEHKKYSDSMLNANNLVELTQIGMMHEFSQQKKADSLQQAKEEELRKVKDQQKQLEYEQNLERQQTYTYFGAGLAFLMLALVFVAFRGYRNKQKANLLITQQKKEVEEQKTVIEEKHKEITDSISYANRIQTALLHSDKNWEQVSPWHFIFFRPKDVVSGDFYWAHSVANEKSTWVVADCTGHGVPGALMSMLGISYLNEIVVEQNITDPAQVLNKLREKIKTAFTQTSSSQPHRDGMDAAVCVWNKKTNELQYAGANNPVWIVKKVDELTSVESPDCKSRHLSTHHFQLIELAPDKMPVGMHENDSVSFTTKTLILEKNDIIYSFSDGYADQFGGDPSQGAGGKKLKQVNLKKLLLSVAHLEATQQEEKIREHFMQWKGNFEQLDDICLTGIKII